MRIHVARSFLQRARGLLGRAPLAADEALLIRPCSSIHTFGMRFTIDVVFIDARGYVLAVHARRWAPGASRVAAAPSAVLEMAPGAARREGLEPGTPSDSGPRRRPQRRHDAAGTTAAAATATSHHGLGADSAALAPAEFVIVAPALLALTLAMLQTGLAYHARSIVNYASFEAARAGSVAHAGLASMRLAFARAMTSYYGGGRDLAEIANSFAAAQLDLATALAHRDGFAHPRELRRLPQPGGRATPADPRHECSHPPSWGCSTVRPSARTATPTRQATALARRSPTPICSSCA